MPGSHHGPSIKNPRVYDALRRRGYAKARAAAISNARRTKAFNFGAKVGQTIAGNLVRGAGGRFSAGTGVAAPTARQTRAADRRDARAKRRDDTARARDAAARAEDAQREKEDAYVAAGKNARERAARRRAVTTARRKRAADAREARRQAREQERQTRAEEDAGEQRARAQDQAERDAARAAKPKKGGGGGGGKAKPSDEDKQAAKNEAKATRAAATAQAAGLSAGNLELLRAAAETGADAQQSAALVAVGLAIVNPDTGQAETTDQGRRALAALERGDVRGYRAALQDARSRMQRERAAAERRAAADARRQTADEGTIDEPAPRRGRDVNTKPVVTKERYGGTPRGDLPDSAFAGPDRSFPIMTAQDVRDAVRALGRTKHNQATVKRGILRRARAIGAMDALPASWREKAAPATLATFKDAHGRDRWLTITTSAYEDRDTEIITTKGIAFAVAYGDVTGKRGTLRYWHVPGADLGVCDFQAQTGPGGRFLVESGTFFGPREAALGAAMARKGWQMSPGFLHPRSEPAPLTVGGRTLGAYDYPVIFERSPTPPNRASNLFGTFTTTHKEFRMNEEKRAQLKELVGGDDALLADLLGRIDQTDKAAQDQGMAYKDAPPWAQALLSRLDAVEAALKDAPAAEAEVEVEIEAPSEPAEADDGDGVLDDAAFADLVADRVAARLAPPAAQKEAPAAADDPRIAALTAQVQALTATVKELTGDMPAASRNALGIAVPESLATALTAKDASAPDPLAQFLNGFAPIAGAPR